MKKLGALNPGTIFTYAKEQFVVLEKLHDGVFCILAQSGESVAFHTGGDEPRNNYAKSTLRQHIEGPWLDALIANGGSKADMIPFAVDLRPTDQSEGYGTLDGVLAAPLTLWQYGRYKDIIPLNEDDWWWLVTPWACPWLRSPYTSSTTYAWRVSSDGYCNRSVCTSSYGVRPALKLNSELLVSVEGDDEEEDAGDSNDRGVDLSRVDTAALLKEIERRVVGRTCDGCDAEHEGREEKT